MEVFAPPMDSAHPADATAALAPPMVYALPLAHGCGGATAACPVPAAFAIARASPQLPPLS